MPTREVDESVLDHGRRRPRGYERRPASGPLPPAIDVDDRELRGRTLDLSDDVPGRNPEHRAMVGRRSSLLGLRVGLVGPVGPVRPVVGRGSLVGVPRDDRRRPPICAVGAERPDRPRIEEHGHEAVAAVDCYRRPRQIDAPAPRAVGRDRDQFAVDADVDAGLGRGVTADAPRKADLPAGRPLRGVVRRDDPAAAPHLSLEVVPPDRPRDGEDAPGEGVNRVDRGESLGFGRPAHVPATGAVATAGNEDGPECRGEEPSPREASGHGSEAVSSSAASVSSRSIRSRVEGWVAGKMSLESNSRSPPNW